MKREENHAEQNARGWSETIAQLVAALECDYDRLTELREERADIAGDEERMALGEGREALAAWDEEHGEELKDLIESATIDGDEAKEREHIEQRIQECPLSVQVRGGWYSPGQAHDRIGEPEEFEILLSTGGPALRIRGELDEHCEPSRAWLEFQDWGTPWTEFHGEGAPAQDTLLTFCRVFYFGG